MSTSETRTPIRRRTAEANAPKVEHRSLSIPEALDICAKISREEVITGYSLEEWTRTREIIVCSDPSTGRLRGAVLIHHLFLGWSEIAVVFVFNEHRGQGVGQLLVREALRRIRDSERRAILFFCDDSMANIAGAVGLDIHDSERDFAGKSLSHLLFIRWLYPMQWRSDKFRRQEIRRKTALSGISFTFRIASDE